MNLELDYLPPQERKKILFISDDLRAHSGIATVAREIVLSTAHHFNWVSIGGGINHPEAGKKLDLSPATNETTGLKDSSIIMYPVNDYGNPDVIRQLIAIEKPDALMMITDPRYYVWLFQMENEIRKHIPIVYLNIWDNFPTPLWNLPYYESCDLLLAISKQTKLINKLVLEHGNVDYIDLDNADEFIGEKSTKSTPRLVKYVPHGLNDNIFKPLDKNDVELKDFKNKLFKGKQYDFSILFNSRNIRRKQIPDTILAYKHFIDSLPEGKSKSCCLVLHTDKISDHGTDLEAVIEALAPFPHYNIVFTEGQFSPYQMNLLYNSTDCQILLTSNEGWGLSLTESLLAGNPIVANVTGGMQDQMRFEDDEEQWFTPSAEIPSNHTGRFKKHGMWAFPVYPLTRNLQGSPPTPYIWDDHCRPEDAAKCLKELYEMSKEERIERGLAGRAWATSHEAGFTSEHQGKRIIDAFKSLFVIWKPRESCELINANEVKDRTVKHNLLY